MTKNNQWATATRPPFAASAPHQVVGVGLENSCPSCDSQPRPPAPGLVAASAPLGRLRAALLAGTLVLARTPARPGGQLRVARERATCPVPPPPPTPRPRDDQSGIASSFSRTGC